MRKRFMSGYGPHRRQGEREEDFVPTRWMRFKSWLRETLDQPACMFVTICLVFFGFLGGAIHVIRANRDARNDALCSPLRYGDKWERARGLLLVHCWSDKGVLTEKYVVVDP